MPDELVECPDCDGKGEYRRPHERAKRVCDTCMGTGLARKQHVVEYDREEPSDER